MLTQRHQLVKGIHNQEATPRPLPPEIQGWPLVGVLPSLLQDPFGFLVRAWKRQGDIYTLNLGFTKMIFCNHPRHAQHLMRDNAQNYSKGGPVWDSLRGFVGNGVIVSSGDFWLRQRRLMQPQFHRQRLAALTTLMADAIDEALQSWESAATTGQPVNLTPTFNQLAMRVVVKTLFGTALTAQELDEVSDLMTFALGYLLVDASTKALPAWLPIPGKRRFQQALARFDQLVYQIIAKSRQGIGPENHLLAMLLNSVDEETGQRMEDRQLRDEVATLFVAGYETTSVALSWTLHFLTQQPVVMVKMQAEVDQVLADGRRPTFADLPNLTYTRMVLQETLRLYPPSYWLPRTAMAEDEIDGYVIPAGAQVVAFIYAYHRHPQFWPEPDHFDPERFTPEQSVGRDHFAWIPFGVGQRQCIGRDFALMEAQLALAMIVQRYQFSAATTQPVKPVLSGILRPKGGVFVYVRSRK